MEKVFILRWYGPFLFEQLRTWEISQKNTFNLYLIGGKKKYSKKKIHYYIGKAERYLLSDIWGIERRGFFNGREKWAKGFENQRV